MIVFVTFLGLLKERIERMLAELLVEKFGGEEVLASTFRTHLAFDVHLYEKDFRDFVKGCSRIQFFAVANDVVASMEQIRKLIFLECLELGNQLLDFLVACVCMGNICDFFQRLRHLEMHNAPILRFPTVVCDKETRAR